MFAMCGVGTLSAQTWSNFEGEFTSKIHSVTKFKSQTLTKNILAKLIIKAVMKKHIDNNPINYTGTYESITISKGNKLKSISSYDNCVTIIHKEGSKMTSTIYYPYIKKGYIMERDIEKDEKNAEKMLNGDPEKTGETIEIMGHTCDIYKLKYEQITDTLDTKTTLNIHNEFAMCDDPDLPPADKEYVKGVKGLPLKVINNIVSQTSNKMMNVDFVMSLATQLTSIKKRPVDDSEFDVPSDIKLYDMEKDAKTVSKIIEENKKYMVKKGLWKEDNPDESKIYDNLTEEWDY